MAAAAHSDYVFARYKYSYLLTYLLLIFYYFVTNLLTRPIDDTKIKRAQPIIGLLRLATTN